MLLMDRKKYRNNMSALITILLFAMIVIAFLFLLDSFAGKSEQEQAAFLENAVRRAVITCFAIEGRYPPSLAYLSSRYGLQSALENDRFIVSYTVFASNIYPDIAVLKVGVGE